MAETIFGKIARGEIAVSLVYEDETCVAFPDIAPVAPVHFLVIPRRAYEDATVADEETLGHLFKVAAHIGAQNCPDGFRLVTNIGDEGGQSVPHLHVHVLGGRALGWPAG